MILKVAKYAITCMVLICLATTPASADEGPAIVLHFDEGSGTIAHDSSGNGNNGIIQDVSWAEGISGTSLTFDGKQGNVDIADSVSLRPQNFTLSVWIKPQIKKSSIITQLPIVTKNTHETSKLDHGFSVYYTSFGINLQTAYGGSSNSAGLGVDLPVNTWSHIVTQYDGKNYIFYTNGERRNLGGHISPMLINYSADDLWVGKANSSICNYYNNTCQISYDYFNGSIDELYLFSRILNSSEIQLLYSNQYYWTASKIGVFRNNKTWILDASGNGVYGAGDPTYTFGTVGDRYVTGDWNGNGKTEIGVVRNNKTWLLDASGNGAYGIGDLTYSFGKAGDVYVTGDWTGNGTTRIGVVRTNTTWLLDASGDGKWGPGDYQYTFGKAGDMYVTGDWNNDRKTEIGVVRNNKTWLLDASGNGAYGIGDLSYTFGKAGDVYLTGDWTGTGTTRIGVVRTNTTWLLDASGDGAYGAGDLTYTFGKAGDRYVTGKWS